jgi:tetratricopeptide (TPR) repeat protein
MVSDFVMLSCDELYLSRPPNINFMAAAGKRKLKSKISKKRSGKRSVKRVKKTQFRAALPWIGLIAVSAFACMWPVIQSEFTELDDKHLILTRIPRMMERPVGVWTSSIFSPHYKPLVLLSWIVEGSIFGLKSSVLHFNNLLLHAFNSILAFFIAFRISQYFDITRSRAEMTAVFAGLLFAVHPLHVESIAWAIERKDVLYTCFFFLGILAYFRYLDKPGLKWMLICTLCFAGSALSKAPAIVFPAILILIDYTAGRKLSLARITEKWPLMIVFVIALILFGVFSSGGGGSASGTEGSIAKMISEKPVSNVYPLTELPSFYSKIALIGLKGTFWYLHAYIPAGLSLAYPYRAWVPAIGHGIHLLPLLLAIGAFLIWRSRKQRPFLFFTHALFFIALSPALIRTGLGKGIFLSDRYVYLGLLGLMLFVAGGLLYLMDRKQWPAKRQYAVLGSIVVLLGTLSFIQARVWHTGESLWTNVINKYPSIDYAYVNRAIWYKDNNQQEMAMRDLNKAVELDQFDQHALIHRGTTLRGLGRGNEALADFNQALVRKPGDEHALNGKANVLFQMQRYEEAEATYTEGLNIKPRMATLWVNRAAARYYLGKYQEALEDLDRGERLSPGYSGIYQKRTVIYMSLRDYENAVVSSRKLAELEPQNHANLGDLGVALQNLGRHQEAIDAFTQAIQVFDKGARYYRERAVSYRAIGNSAAAARDAEKAKSL